ncbi:GNAT family N-acetyltransferase [Tepidiforma flava]|uniref:GNAT family N-acetyltransferase n=1 Tax=Tepidiforma flava TaxID=3004094 RepID=A0ABY7MAG3_9CHLR|nr:GNAT family N-acetyltransferase [Tepidiforma flava]WBL37522.1 GNAT family N-acetyltransferase [Tepidiforma flava]
MRIRWAGPGDLGVIIELIRALAEYEREPEAVRLVPEVLAGHLFGERPYAEVLLAEDAEGVQGFALFFHTFSTWEGRPGIWLEDLFVRPAARGKGYGRALLARLAALALERGCARLEWAVLDWNEPAIGFYRALGAMPMDEWTTYRLTGEALARLGDEGRRAGG